MLCLSLGEIIDEELFQATHDSMEAVNSQNGARPLSEGMQKPEMATSAGCHKWKCLQCTCISTGGAVLIANYTPTNLAVILKAWNTYMRWLLQINQSFWRSILQNLIEIKAMCMGPEEVYGRDVKFILNNCKLVGVQFADLAIWVGFRSKCSVLVFVLGLRSFVTKWIPARKVIIAGTVIR